MPSDLLPTPSAAIQPRTLAQGETLFRQGDQSFAIFVVLHGRLRLIRHLADGAIVTLHIARPGDTFAEAALYSPVYHCDAIADVATEIDIHPKVDLSKALDADPAAARSFMARMARQIIFLRARLELRNIRSAEERVMQFLRLEIKDGEQQICFANPLKDIASEIGLTHETFYRTLSTLERCGLINRNGRSITLNAIT